MYTGFLRIDGVRGLKLFRFTSKEELNRIIQYVKSVYLPEFYTIIPDDRTFREEEKKGSAEGTIPVGLRFIGCMGNIGIENLLINKAV